MERGVDGVGQCEYDDVGWSYKTRLNIEWKEASYNGLKERMERY